MPAPNGSTFDGNANTSPPTTAPYRPGVNDFNGAALQNDMRPGRAPDPLTMPTAELFNSTAYMVVSACKMIPSASISVNAGASPTVAFWTTAANKITTNPFTTVRNAAGDYSITAPANTLPTPNAFPKASLAVALGAHNYGVSAVPITNGIRVTTTQDGALTDLSFRADFY